MRTKRFIAALILSLCVFASFSFAWTRGDIRDEVRRLVRDVDTTNQRWTDAVLNTRINLAEKEFVRKTRCIEKSEYTTTVVNISTYILPSNILSSRRISYAIIPLTGTTTNYRLMEYYTKEGLDVKYPFWENADASDPRRYFYEQDRITIYPKPSSTYAGYQFLKHDYYALPDDMDEDTDIPFNNLGYLYSFHESIKWYVCYLCAIDSGDTVAQDRFGAAWKMAIDTAKNEMNDRPDRRGGFSVK